MSDEPIMEQSAAEYAARAEAAVGSQAQTLALLAIASAVESLDLTINQINQQTEEVTQ